MKITSTRKIEEAVIELYKRSVKKEDEIEAEKAAKTIQDIISSFRLISIFTKENHVEIVKKLYFSKDNILEIGIRKMSDKVFVQEKTLYTYRKKYCKIIENFL